MLIPLFCQFYQKLCTFYLFTYYPTQWEDWKNILESPFHFVVPNLLYVGLAKIRERIEGQIKILTVLFLPLHCAVALDGYCVQVTATV